MKYSVSLLPEARKKRILGKKKTAKIKGICLSLLIIAFAVTLIAVGANVFASQKLKTVRAKDAEYQQKVSELSKYREINAELESKIALIDSIKVKEPYLYNVIVEVSNAITPGVSIESFECTDWNATRTCTLSGKCDNRQQYLDFEKSLQELAVVSSVSCTSFTGQVGTADGFATFTIVINTNGSGVNLDEIPTIPAFEGPGTTEIDENAGVTG